MAALVSRYLGQPSCRARRLLLLCIPGDARDLRIVLDDVAEVRLDIDPHEFLALPDLERKRSWVFDVLERGLPVAGRELGLPEALVAAALERARVAGLVDQWDWGPSLSKDKRRRAFVRVTHDVDAAVLRFVVTSDGHDHLLHEVQTTPSQRAFVPMLGSIRWLDAQTVEWRDADGRPVHRANVDNHSS